jgi:hypothetical protein
MDLEFISNTQQIIGGFQSSCTAEVVISPIIGITIIGVVNFTKTIDMFCEELLVTKS